MDVPGGGVGAGVCASALARPRHDAAHPTIIDRSRLIGSSNVLHLLQTANAPGSKKVRAALRFLRAMKPHPRQQASSPGEPRGFRRRMSQALRLQKQESSSFLQKRTKKLLLMKESRGQIDKSFLFLFFKKEELPSYSSINRASSTNATASTAASP
jgi:hypothetical protein